MTQSQGKPFIRRGLAALTVFLLAALPACAADGGKNLGTAPKPEPVVEEAPPEPEPVRWPLTGLPVDDGALPEEVFGDPLTGDFGPALSVKIENSSAARPQGGIERADVVWEQLVEGGMTRFVAMFHSDLPEALGPIRSARPMDAAITGTAGGVFAFSGGLWAYQTKIAETGVVMVSDDGGSPGFYRDPNRSGDHRLFGNAGQFLAQGAEEEPPPPLFVFDDEEPSALADGEPATKVSISFPASHPSWEWDGAAWQRSESGQAAHAESGERLAAANVVVVWVDIHDTGNRDSAGSMVPETILTGDGRATVFSEGHMVDAVWEKGEAADALKLQSENGEEITLSPGNTWVELVPNVGGSVSAS